MIQFPNAKINLGLDILRRRPDGYHDIVTLMVPVGWCDVLEIVPAQGPDTTLTTSGRPVECAPQKNLVMKAYRALGERVELPPVDIYLHKIIPDGAGLGGGSADAAFTLTGLNRLFALGLSLDELAEVAAGVGADCPLFVYNRPMWARGTGVELTPAELPLPAGMWVGIVKPPVGVSTAQAYAGVTPREPAVDLSERLKAPVEQWQEAVVNAFEPSVFAACPLAPIKEGLLEMGAVYASMSGSGSAVYGLFASGDNLAERLKARFDGCDIFAGPLIE